MSATKAVSVATFPNLAAAFLVIVEDNGGHLIGTVYPGEKINLDEFLVPAPWWHLLDAAEGALRRLREANEADFETFVIGEASEQDAIRERQGDLAQATRLLNDYFDGWPDDHHPTTQEPRDG